MLLDSGCHYFVKVDFFYVYERYWSMVFFPPDGFGNMIILFSIILIKKVSRLFFEKVYVG